MNKKQDWGRLNRKSLPYILIMPGLLLLGNSLQLLQGSSLIKVLDKEFLTSMGELIFVPLFTLNIIHLGEVIVSRTTLKFWQQIIFKTIFCLIGIILATWIAEHIEALYGVADDDDFLAFGTFKLSPSATNYVTNAFLSTAIALPLFFVKERRTRLERNLAARQAEVEKLAKLQSQSRLEALESKLQPHFLYNALNTLAELIYSDPGRAEQVVLGLSELFRYNLRKDDDHLVPLKEELEIAKTYLSIEMIRFDGMLQYNLDVQPDLLNLKIPRFFIQPLVENAIKHGTSRLTNGLIEIKIWKDDPGHLNITIADNGPHFPDNFKFGFGLGSTIEKLNLLYPENYELSWRNSPSKSIHISLKQEAYA